MSNKANYEFFLHRYSEYLSPFVETYALCLLPNHFHLLVRVKDIENGAGSERGDTSQPSHPTRDATTEAFRKFFTSYAMAINKQQHRHGALFERPFQRKAVSNSKYLANLVFYIHANPQQHGITDDFRFYPWSSYEKIVKNNPTRLQKEAVLQWFSSPENYVAYHNQKMDLEIIKEMMIE